MTIEVRRVSVPPSLDDENDPNVVDYRRAVELRNIVEALGYGSDDFASSAEEDLPSWHREHEPRQLFVATVPDAREPGRPGVVGRGFVESRREDGWPVAWVAVQVLPEYRGRGVGTAVADAVEAAAREAGATRLLVYVVSPDGPGERLRSPTGSGSVPLGNDEVRFLLGRGYRLEQIERGSRLGLPLDADDLARRLDDARRTSGPDYRLVHWTGGTPRHWREDLAMLLTRMSTDAPSAGLDEPEDVWTVDRLVAQQESDREAPVASLTAAVEHVPSGRLVAFSELSVSDEVTRPVWQEDTLVLREHRGHGLGLLVKLGNLEQLHLERPGHPSVLTFNAEENRHMLAINERLGFVPVGYEGAWRKDLI
ncbi:GNAT family N-acetyltransferase [Agreia sp. PsM10]|uniref:GNAT family N-acetyltransferase n=1 Tax=Agreia sp. PsM10 TaxID=3030533 RepID=UPI00263B1B43|nr:GNAT family N-acetyltransferase [Agreia sp. PsM10]MDN4642050.1 GNAT family N-acetyltransferase [Agreia sp. PsM10]